VMIELTVMKTATAQDLTGAARSFARSDIDTLTQGSILKLEGVKEQRGVSKSMAPNQTNPATMCTSVTLSVSPPARKDR